MFEDEPIKPNAEHAFPRPLDGLSVDELRAYIQDLKNEITRAERDINAKKASAEAALSVFK